MTTIKNALRQYVFFAQQFQLRFFRQWQEKRFIVLHPRHTRVRSARPIG
ncbi:MAG: hypothetical protein IKI21_10515 [Oscillospiraceae bacterium]|nr:hypothetical protein [Oscillospiraceae bacterium]